MIVLGAEAAYFQVHIAMKSTVPALKYNSLLQMSFYIRVKMQVETYIFYYSDLRLRCSHIYLQTICT